MAYKKPILIAVCAAIVAVAGFFAYLKIAFPEVRCEAAKHPDTPEKYADCVSCHVKATAMVAQDWKDSKHGVMLVKCVVCHGQPDGKGSIAFKAKPDPMDICARCHDPAIKRMVAKYGERPDCNSCHPHHQNTIHRDAYEPPVFSGKTSF